MVNSLSINRRQHLGTKIARWSLFALLIFTPLARASVQGWAVTIIHLLTLIAMIAFLIEKSLTWNWTWLKTPLDTPILILIILSILSTIFSMHQYTSIWSVTLLFNYVIIFYLTINTIRTRSQFRQLIYIIIGVAAFLSIFGLFKLSGANPFPWWNYTDIKTYGRFTATFGNSNHMAGYMEMAIPLLLGSLLTGFRASKITFMICLAFIMFLAIFLSLSRGGWLGLGIGLAFMTFALLMGRRHREKYIFVTLACGLLVLAFITLSSTQVAERIRTFEQKGDISTVKSRMKRWPGTVEMIKDHPLSGTGPGTYATVFTQHHPPGYDNYHFYAHNDYLHFTAEVGLFLMAVVVWMMIALYRKAFEKLKSPSRLVRGTTMGTVAGITAIMVHSFGDFNLNIPANAILFTVLTALAAGPVPLDNVSRIRINQTQLITDPLLQNGINDLL